MKPSLCIELMFNLLGIMRVQKNIFLWKFKIFVLILVCWKFQKINIGDIHQKIPDEEYRYHSILQFSFLHSEQQGKFFIDHSTYNQGINACV